MLKDKIIEKKFDDIYIDQVYVHYNGKAIPHNDCPYNALKLTLKKPERQNLDKYIVLKYGELEPKLFELSLYENQQELVYTKHLVLEETNEGFNIYKIIKGKQISLIASTSDSGFEDKIIKYLEYKVKDTRVLALSRSQQRQELKNVLVSGKIPLAQNIKKISNRSDEYCLSYIDLDDLPVGDTPAWDSFISQFAHEEYKEIFMAWVYSIFVSDNKSRQLLWIHGRGKSGKSTAANTIVDTLKEINPSLCMAMEDHRFNVDKYSNASYEKAILVIVADCTERAILIRKEVKNLTGGDNVPIRNMGKEKRTEKLYSKIICTSNTHPYVNLDNDHELTRILYLALDDKKVAEARKQWPEKYPGIRWDGLLKEEIWCFLQKCKPYYYKWLSEDMDNFKMPPVMLEAIQKESVYYTKREISSFWEHNIIQKPNTKLSLDHLQEIVVKFLGLKTITYKVKSFLLTHIRSLDIPVYSLGIGNALYIEGYAVRKEGFKTMSQLINEKLKQCD